MWLNLYFRDGVFVRVTQVFCRFVSALAGVLCCVRCCLFTRGYDIVSRGLINLFGGLWGEIIFYSTFWGT